MPRTPTRSASPMSDVDEQVSETSEPEESPTVEPGPSSSTSKGKAKASTGKGKGKGGGQQGRSRATVVCAECKRLKLKCNREQPCNQCAPKNKADKCIYTPEASVKVDVPNVNIRVKAIERFLMLFSGGVPVSEFTSIHQPIAEETRKEMDEYLASGGELRPGTFASNLASGSGLPQSDSAKGSLLSDLHDLAHPYVHAILQSEGIPLDGFCACDHPPTTSVAKIVVKEEEGREVLDVNMNPDVVPERQLKSAPKPGLKLPPTSRFPDGMAALPAANAYYQAAQGPHSSYYPPSAGAMRAFVRSPGPTSSPVTPATSDPSFSKTSTAATASSKPTVTLDLINALPPPAKWTEMLSRAQSVLAETPVELGLRSRTAALPQELKDMFRGELSKSSGWLALTKRVKRCLNFWKDHIPKPSRQRSVPAPRASTPASVPSRAPRESRQNPTRAGPAGAIDAAPRDTPRGSASGRPGPQVATQQSERSRAPNPSQSSPSNPQPLPPAYESLPFFAVICSLLALGADPAQDQETGKVDSAPYLLALSEQALGMWINGGEYIPPDRTGDVTDEVILEARADYFRACSLAIQFYLNKTSPSVPASRRDGLWLKPYRHPNQRQLVNLASKMATQLASWEYEEGLVPVRDADSDPFLVDITEEAKLIPKIAIAEGEEARLRLFWQVLYYDACIAGMFQRDPLIPQSRCLAATLPKLAPDYREMVAAVFRPPEGQDVPMAPAGEGSQSAPPVTVDQTADEDRLRIERLFLVMRARITRLSAIVNRRLVRGHTSAQAAELAGEVEALFANAPVELRWFWERAVEGTTAELLARGDSIESVDASPSTPTVTTSAKSKGKSRAVDGSNNPKASRLALDGDGDGEGQTVSLSEGSDPSKLRMRTLSCELVLMAQLLVVRIYAPFAPKLRPLPSGSTASVTVCEPLLNASKAIIRAAKLMHRPTQTYPGPSTFLAMCSLDQLVLDATLVCSMHCHGGSVTKSKDDKFGVQKKDSGSGELMQTIGVGLDLLDDACSISKNPTLGTSATATSSSAWGVGAATSTPLETRVVASLRKQWSFKSLAFSPAQSRKRTRSTMEGKAAAAVVESTKEAPVAPREAEAQPRSVTEQPSLPPPPPPVPATTQPRSASPVLVDEPSPIAPPSASTSTPAPPDGSTEETLAARMLPGDLKPRGKARAGVAPQISVRSRGPGSSSTTSKRKQEKKPQTPTQPLLTTLAREVKEDGRMGYIHEDRSSAASPRPVPPPQSQSIPAQDIATRHAPHPPPAHQSYGVYGSSTSTTQPLYNVPISDLGPANRYPQAPVYDGGTVAGGSLPPAPHSGYSGYPTYPPQAPLQATSSYPQHHHSGYPAPSHSQAPMTASASDNLAPGGYSNRQVTDNYYGSGPGPSYGAPAGNEAYMKHGVAPSSYTVLPYPPDPATASGASAPNWQDPHTPSVPMQSPSSSQHHYSAWQSHPSNDANWG